MLDIKSLITLLITVVFSSKGCQTVQKDQPGNQFNTSNEIKRAGLLKNIDNLQLQVSSTEASTIFVNFYHKFDDKDAFKTIPLDKGSDGLWSASLVDYHHKFYDIRVTTDNGSSLKTLPSDVRIVGPNGKRAYVANMSESDPENWASDHFVSFPKETDYIIYEAQIRDFTIDPSSGVKSPGTFTGFVESSSVNENINTGLTHLVEMGVTHVHLLPFFDFKSIDELSPTKKYNWGYEPQHYNAVEGSFSTDATDPIRRIRELKQMIMELHKRNIAVVMDVVYNHTSDYKSHPFEILQPGEFYRQFSDGEYSNASACGNEVATERPAVRDFILSSLKYWMQEFHIDGFRFDLMGIHDIEGMNHIARELQAVNPQVLLYGEGWTAGRSPLPESKRATKANAKQLSNISVFSDEFRDGLKGHFSDLPQKGYVSGNTDLRESVKFGIVGAIDHPQIDYSKVNYTKKPWASSPKQMIAYVSCHDDYTLWDKLSGANPESLISELKKMHMLSSLAVLTSQGRPFLHSGVEFLRTKYMDHNSFESPDSVNSLKWNQKYEHFDVFSFHRDLIRLRKAHPAFHLQTAEEVRNLLQFEEVENENVLVFKLGPYANGDPWRYIYVILNGGPLPYEYTLPHPEMKSVIIDSTVVLEGQIVTGSSLRIEGHSGQILFVEV